MIASAVANVVGSAIAGALLDLDGAFGLRGWQLLFIVTGAPAIVLAPLVLRMLPDSPSRAAWLKPDEKQWLADELAAEVAGDHREHGLSALRDPRVLLLCATFFGFPFAAYGLSYWLPTIVEGFGVSRTVNGLLNAGLWSLVAAALWLMPRLVGAGRPRALHIVLPALIGACALVASVLLPGPAAKFVALCIAAAAIFAGQPIFWTLPPRFLRGSAAAAGFAAINATGNLGGFVAQAAIPWTAATTGTVLLPMLLLAVALVLVAIGVVAVERRLKMP
jgi:MFS family permease